MKAWLLSSLLYFGLYKKIKNWNGLKHAAKKKKKSLPRFPKEKNKTIGSGEKKKQPKKELKKDHFNKPKKTFIFT